MCQVPGCGARIKRPWNHIYQGQKHKNLAMADKFTCITLTKQCEVVAEDTTTEQLTTSENSTSEGTSEGTSETTEGNEENTTTQDVTRENTTAAEPKEVKCTGRQTFGDTRNLKMFKLDAPILVEYHK